MTRYCYILTEGAQDVALLIKLLRFEGIKQIQKRSQVDSFWDELIPKTFPYNDELNKQVPVPKFLQSNDLSIAIQSAIGDNRLVDTLQEDLAGIGIVLDADNYEPQTRLDRIKTGIDNLHLGLDVPAQGGIVGQGEYLMVLNLFGLVESQPIAMCTVQFFSYFAYLLTS